MAFADYTTEDGYADAEAFFDDVVATGKIPGDEGSGRSDEYVHFIYDKSFDKGYVEVVLYLHPDDWDYNQEDVSSFTNLEAAVYAKVNNPDSLTREKIEEAWAARTMLGRPDVDGVYVDGSHYERIPKDEYIPLVDKVGHDYYSIGERIELVGDDMWDADKLASIFAVDMQWAIDEATALLDKMYNILNS